MNKKTIFGRLKKEFKRCNKEYRIHLIFLIMLWICTFITLVGVCIRRWPVAICAVLGELCFLAGWIDAEFHLACTEARMKRYARIVANLNRKSEKMDKKNVV